MFIWLWMYATRIPAMRKVDGLDVKSKVGGTGRQLDGVLPDRVQWIAHNYNHLHEAPTVFYAVVIALAVLSADHHFNVMLAWTYVGLRIVHSLFQLLVNRVIVRFAIFALSSMVLIALTLHLLIAVFH